MNEQKYEFEFEQLGEANGEARAIVTARLIGDDVAIHIDNVNLLSSRSRDAFLKVFKEKTGDGAGTFAAEQELLRVVQEMKKAKPAAKPDRQEITDKLLAEMPEHVRKDAEDYLRSPDIIQSIKQDIVSLGVIGDELVTLGTYIVGTSRLLKRPLAAINRGASSSGKSHGIKIVASMFPPESKLETHRMSPTALYYLPADALIHTFVVAGERARQQDEEHQDATKALREMISDGVLRGCITEKVDGRLCAVPFEKQGPIAFVESTSASTIFAEDLNRCLVFQCDESKEQTQRIIRATADRAASAQAPVEDLIIPIHHAIQRMLRPVDVIIPYAPFLAESFPTARVEARRAMPHLLGTIKAVALLRQFQKEIVNNTITADAHDYAIALEIVRPSINQLRGGIDEQVQRVWFAIAKHTINADPSQEDLEFSRSMVATWSGMRPSDSNGRLRVLAELGFIIETQEGKGSRPAKYKIASAATRPDIEALEDVDLPTPIEVHQS